MQNIKYLEPTGGRNS